MWLDAKAVVVKMAGWLIAPLWLLEVVNDFVNVIFILFELVKDFLHDSSCG